MGYPSTVLSFQLSPGKGTALAWLSILKPLTRILLLLWAVCYQNEGLCCSHGSRCPNTQSFWGCADTNSLCAHGLCAVLCQEGESSAEEEEHSEEECETMTVSECVRDDQYDEKVEEDEQMLEKFKQERMDEMFPDEVDTPRDVPARVR